MRANEPGSSPLGTSEADRPGRPAQRGRSDAAARIRSGRRRFGPGQAGAQAILEIGGDAAEKGGVAHQEPALGRLDPTGRDFRCRMMAFFIFEGTGLVCERVYFDSATIRLQLTP